MSLKYLLTALVASQAVFAASDCGDTKIKSQSDADGINSCSTIEGDITIDESYSGSLELSGIEEITGGLKCAEGTNVTAITASSLTTIGNVFDLNGLTTLTLLDFAELETVGGINWVALPKLQSLNFAKGISKAGDVSIVNTGLNDIKINLETVSIFKIQDNLQLKTLDIDGLKNASKEVTFSGNFDTLEVNLPNLGTAKSMTFENISAVSLPSLEKLTGPLSFKGTKFETFSAPNLTHTGDLTFNDNSKLSNISMPVLTTIEGAFNIKRDDELNIISLSNLKKVTGGVDISGTFNEISLGSLEDVQGGFNLQSTRGNFTCSDFEKLKNDRVIKGTYNCEATSDNPKDKNGNSATGTKNSDTSSGAAVFTGANVPVVGIAAIFGALASLM